MQMEYSPDDIAAARSLQFFAFTSTSIATFWTYEYACTLHEEWTFLLRSRCTKVKAIYIVTRYVPFLLLTTNLYLSFIPNENPDKCRVLVNICSGFGTISVICSECFFILRTYALWNKNRIVLAAMISTFLTFIVVSMSLQVVFATTVPVTYATSAIPGITGCYQSSSSFQLFISFIFLPAFQLGLITLTLIRAIQSWQSTQGRHLYIVLLTHNIFYYACGLLFSVANILPPLLLHYAYYSILHNFQYIILTVLATRLHRHLWQMDQRVVHGSDVVSIPMADMSFADCTV
ncbi:hypothetical protein DEU56DRAFT_96895 [Suillus clintonianus]|uniref:uncharacterized protein n=1 Tax=Suillus clintonianus TaxID=1904413 RepID=UPI001B87D7CA|nr:uncharacterized protein DEU56DRAFT_96895 [Suillus clintonianus]KAG2121308.1 hypothetical protein DEU56DRAFT_96895 [Suillus clintonianus]